MQDFPSDIVSLKMPLYVLTIKKTVANYDLDYVKQLFCAVCRATNMLLSSFSMLHCLP